MMLMTSTQILDAVQRSLQENIGPELQTDYARVQLLAALVAIREIIDRLDHGDPCSNENSRLEGSMQHLAKGARSESPALAAKLEECLKDASALKDPRERNYALNEGLWRILRDAERDDAFRVLRLVSENIQATCAEDQRWVSPEAIASLK